MFISVVYSVAVISVLLMLAWSLEYRLKISDTVWGLRVRSVYTFLVALSSLTFIIYFSMYAHAAGRPHPLLI